MMAWSRRVKLCLVPAVIRRGPGFLPVERGGQANDNARWWHPTVFIIRELRLVIEVPRGVARAVLWPIICGMREAAGRGEMVVLDALPPGWTWRVMRGLAVRGVG